VRGAGVLAERKSQARYRRGGIYYQDDIITEPFTFDDGSIVVPSKPGLGIELDEDKLKHYRIS